MRLAIKNQYTSKQREQKDLPGTLAMLAGRTFNEANYVGNSQGKSTVYRAWRTSMRPKSTQKHVGTRVSDVLGKPNGYVYRGADASLCHPPHEAALNAIVVKTHKPNTMAQAPSTYDASNNRCVGPNPESTVTKTASTVTRPGYASTARDYLYRRGYLPEQHASFAPDRSQRYVDVDGKLLAPTDSPTKGSQVFRMTKCDGAAMAAVAAAGAAAGCQSCLTTFKPTNRAFRTSGAVTSSARVAKLQHGTLMRENHTHHKMGLGAHSTNYLPGTFARRTIKTITERNCNVGSLGLTRIRHARRSPFVRYGACRDCMC